VLWAARWQMENVIWASQRKGREGTATEVVTSPQGLPIPNPDTKGLRCPALRRGVCVPRNSRLCVRRCISLINSFVVRRYLQPVLAALQ